MKTTIMFFSGRAPRSALSSVIPEKKRPRQCLGRFFVYSSSSSSSSPAIQPMGS